MELDKAETIFRKSDLRYDRVYGNIVITSDFALLYEWEIEVLRWHWDHSQGVSIGIEEMNYDVGILERNIYAYNNCGRKLCDGGYGDFESGIERFDREDTIKMQLNAVERTLKFWKNEKEAGLQFENIDFDDGKKQYELIIFIDDGTIAKLKSSNKRQYFE